MAGAQLHVRAMGPWQSYGPPGRAPGPLAGARCASPMFSLAHPENIVTQSAILSNLITSKCYQKCAFFFPNIKKQKALGPDSTE